MTDKARWTSLDALRGIAALTVVAHHSLAVLPQFWAVYIGQPTSRLASIMAFSPLHLLWEGHQAVLVFFVLSGFVLSLPYWQGNPPSYGAFLIRRFCRIYLPYLAALAIGALALTAFSRFGLPEARRWDGDVQPWGQPVTLATLVDHVLMLGNYSHNYVNPVLWTLVIEMRISIVFPLLIGFMRRTRHLALPLAFLFSTACHSVTHAAPELPPLANSLVHTGTYLWLFILGAEAARSRALIAAWSRRLPPSAQWLALALALLLLNARWEIGMGSLGALVPHLGAGMVVIICAYAERPARRLAWPPLVALGRISYGLYLLHFIVLYALLYERPAWLPMRAVLWTAPLASLAFAAIFFRLVELPAIRLGASLTRPSALAAPKIAG